MLRIVLAVVALLALMLVGRFVSISMPTPPPDDLGASTGRLAPCPESPNCVSSQADRESQRVDALIMPGPADAAWKQIVQAIEVMPRARIVKNEDGYMHVEFTSFLFRFVDDLELVYDGTVPGFQVRSASRAGHSDMGANRKRVEALRARLHRIVE
jgi:uncharacterized protein (DUF1499 family)